MMAIATKITDWLAGARDVLTRAHDTVAAKAAERDQAEADRRQVVQSLASRPHVLLNYDTELDSVAQQFATSRALAVVASLSGRVRLDARGKFAGLYRPQTLAEAIGQIDGVVLVALVPELRAALRRELERVPYLEGPPMDQRERLLAEADAKIEGLLAEHRQLVDAARELGLHIEDLPETRGARLREAREQEIIDSFNSVNRRAIEKGTLTPATTVEEARR